MKYYKSQIVQLSILNGNILSKQELETLTLDDHSQAELEKWCSTYNDIQSESYGSIHKEREAMRLWAEITNWVKCLSDNKRIEALKESMHLKEHIIECCIQQTCNCIGYLTPDPFDGGGELFRVSALNHISCLLECICQLDKGNWFIENTVKSLEKYYSQL